jgi:succinyl-diaminopimelate desuccinylase
MTEEKNTQNKVPMEDIVTLAKQFIAIPSTADNAVALEDIITLAGNELTDFVMETFFAGGKPSLLIHNAKRGTKKFDIILNAHLDVVAGNEEQYKPNIKDGKLFGRGAYDMKSAAAVMIYLFKELAKQVSYPLALQLVTDEELAGGYGTKSQIDKGIRTNFAIIGECGSNFDVIYETKGLIHAYLTTSGTTAHGAYLWRGQNAIMKMHEAIGILYKHFPTPAKETFESTINISQIATTNETWNAVPDNCTATLDIRVNRNDSETILKKIKDILPEDVELTIDEARQPHYTDPNSKYIQSLKNISKKLNGREIKVRRTFGGSDTNFFSGVGNDAIEFGPIGQGQHDDNENVEINSLEEYYQILKHFLLEIDTK